jgi:hypothetical protein
MRSLGTAALWWRASPGLTVVTAVVPMMAQGQRFATLAALALGGLITGAFAIATIGGRPVLLAVTAVLLALQIVLYWLSRPSGQAIAPPASEWLAPWLVIAVIVCGLTLLIERIVQARTRRHTPQADSPRRRLAPWRFPAALAALLLTSCVLGCGYTITAHDGDGSARTEATVAEISPLPPTLRVVSADPCADGGSSGNCTAEFVIEADDGASSEAIVQRLVTQLRTIGWSLDLEDSSYQGCRAVAGLRHYTDHCLWMDSNGSPLTNDTNWRPGAVVVYIDNI